jgi:hypothetical protein
MVGRQPSTGRRRSATSQAPFAEALRRDFLSRFVESRSVSIAVVYHRASRARCALNNE